METLSTTLAGLDKQGPHHFGMAVVMETFGSTARKAGTMLTGTANGRRVAGTLGGGPVEQDCLLQLARCIEQEKTEIHIVDSFQQAADTIPGQICGGRQKIFLNGRCGDSIAALEQAVALFRGRQSGVLITIVSHPDIAAGTILCIAERKMQTPAESLPVDKEELQRVLDTGKCLFHHHDGRDQYQWFIQPIISSRQLLIFGGGHCGTALAELADWSGFEVTILDTRPQPVSTVSPKSIQWRRYDDLNILDSLGINKNTCIAVMTSDHQQDARALRACLQTDAGYIGMIGSRKKTAAIFMGHPRGEDTNC